MINKKIIWITIVFAVLVSVFFVYKNIFQYQPVFDDINAYGGIKAKLLSEGWQIYLPEGFVSAQDIKFPEIGDCGEGMDAVCMVNIKKGDEIKSFYVELKTDPDTGMLLYWEVGGLVVE